MPLSPSDRVTLIKEIADRLAAEDWNLIDLILKQFDQRTSDIWQGNRDSYVMAVLQDASDQALIDIAEHVGFHFEDRKSKPRIDPPFWRKGMLRVFLSHLATNRKFAGALQQCLLDYGITCFVAHHGIA